MNVFETQKGHDSIEIIASELVKISEQLERANRLKEKELEFYQKLMDMVETPNPFMMGYRD